MDRGASRLRFLLLQVRKPDDPMRPQEMACFSRALGCNTSQIEAWDLLHGAPASRELDAADVVLLGGSGDYSVARGGPWLARALDAMCALCELEKPTFASCWGFQAMARAMGGQVVKDESRAELGTIPVHLTNAGREDPVFGNLSPTFLAPMGHLDTVDRLPPGTTLLASSQKVENQAFRFDGKPIYCTQFHAELNLSDLLDRVRNYPWYVQQIAEVPLDVFAARCQETPETNTLLSRFLQHVFG